MPLLWVNDRWEERLSDGPNPSVETEWSVITDDMDYTILQARLDLLGAIPATVANLPLTEIEVTRQGASGCFRGVAKYTPRSAPEDGKAELTIDSRPESRRSFMALSTVATYAPTGLTAPNQNGFLNVNSDAQAEGTDVYSPVKTFNVVVWYAATRFVGSQPANYQTLQAYLNLMDSLEGCVNSSTFTFTWRGLTFTFLAGECLFASSRLSQQTADLWQVDLEFKKKKNYVEPTLSGWNGSAVTVEGWDEVDFATRPAADSAAKALGPDGIGGYIKRNYPRGDLNLLKVPSP
jgi:hypothetical protein